MKRKYPFCYDQIIMLSTKPYENKIKNIPLLLKHIILYCNGENKKKQESATLNEKK